ncbi:hypothetical protein C900_00477 [Fulvivirga imtechensis AK7]|uniref:DUF4367 domain-containing protein n=1 Tax=Fulvivirga imtechensis AK7 TaxID=1237149 RepID=L8JVZ9_9BACT|nr:hypothetical protein [Fulvivirga imtechensis]ELR72975.1 hypothetical protein C900_00477 [Fulvivirga imtechensis AK7]
MKRTLLYLTLQLSIVFLAQSQNKALHYKELQKHLPTEIMGYASEGDPMGNMFDMNDMSYSSAVREYAKGDSYLTVAIIDYIGASNMYQASTMAWAGNMSYEDDEQKASSITVDGMPGWFSYNKIDKEAQLILGYKDRYLITVSLTDTDDEDIVKTIVQKLGLSKLP